MFPILVVEVYKFGVGMNPSNIAISSNAAPIALVVQPVQGPIVAEFESLLDQLENDEISVESFAEKFRILKSEYTAIMDMSDSTVWNNYHVCQCVVLGRLWNQEMAYPYKMEQKI